MELVLGTMNEETTINEYRTQAEAAGYRKGFSFEDELITFVKGNTHSPDGIRSVSIMKNGKIIGR